MFPVISVVDKVALGQIYLRVLRLSSVHIIPLMLPVRIYLHVTHTNRKNGRSLGNFGFSEALSEMGCIVHMITYNISVILTNNCTKLSLDSQQYI
jgi:hypothetical protein